MPPPLPIPLPLLTRCAFEALRGQGRLVYMIIHARLSKPVLTTMHAEEVGRLLTDVWRDGTSGICDRWRNTTIYTIVVYPYCPPTATTEAVNSTTMEPTTMEPTTMEPTILFHEGWGHHLTLRSAGFVPARSQYAREPLCGDAVCPTVPNTTASRWAAATETGLSCSRTIREETQTERL